MGTDSEAEEDEPGQKKGSAVQGFLPGAPQTYHTTKATSGRVVGGPPGSRRYVSGSIIPGQSKFDATRRAQEEDTGIYALDNIGLFSGLTKAALAVGSVGMLTVPGMLATGGAYIADQVTGQDRFFNKAFAPDRRSVNMEARSWTSPPESEGGGSGGGGRKFATGRPLPDEYSGEDFVPTPLAAPVPINPSAPGPGNPDPPGQIAEDPDGVRRGRRVVGRRSLMSARNFGTGFFHA